MTDPKPTLATGREKGDAMHPTDRQKVERMIVWLTESHLHVHGGYPYDHEEFADRVFIAELDDSKERAKTLIVGYHVRELVTWYNRAQKYLAADEHSTEWDTNHLTGRPFGDWDEAFNETREEHS